MNRTRASGGKSQHQLMGRQAGQPSRHNNLFGTASRVPWRIGTAEHKAARRALIWSAYHSVCVPAIMASTA
jgi:hypothetical protein